MKQPINYQEVLTILRSLKNEHFAGSAEILFSYTEDAEKLRQGVTAALPIGFYPDEKLYSRVQIMRQHWDKLEPLMQENTKLKRLLLHCLRQFGRQMDEVMKEQIDKHTAGL